MEAADSGSLQTASQQAAKGGPCGDSEERGKPSIFWSSRERAFKAVETDGPKRESPLVRAIKITIWGYRIFLSPLFPPACRFTPTCSQYALEAVEIHGALKGSWLALKRILRCHPFNPGGFDPVPPRKS